MFLDQRVSLVLPTYNEKDSLRGVIDAFDSLGIVDEIIVVNNNAVDGTTEVIKKTNATEVYERVQGYGSAVLRGLRESSGELIAVCEPDATFVEVDLLKLLEYSRDYDVVFGSRTTSDLIWAGANMGRLLRLGNWAVAKLMEVLFDGPSLSDVGCTFRIANRTAVEHVLATCRVKGNYFSPEMMIAVVRDRRFKVVQIPVNYRARLGTSTITGEIGGAIRLGLQMIILILVKRMTRSMRP